MIDAGSEQRHLDFGRTGILLVGFVFGDDFGFSNYGGHGFVNEFTTVGSLEGPVSPAPPDWKSGRAGVTVPIRRNAGPVMVATRNRRMSTDAREQVPKTPGGAQAKICSGGSKGKAGPGHRQQSSVPDRRRPHGTEEVSAGAQVERFY